MPTRFLEAVFSLTPMVLVALSLHLLSLPVFWFAGWALPWPRGPTIKTIIEIDLQKWPQDDTPEGISHVIVPEAK